MTKSRTLRFAARLEAELEITPLWYGGELLLAQVDAELGQFEKAREHVLRRLNDTAVHIPAEARWLAGVLLERHPETRDLAIRLYEGNLLDLPNQGQDHLMWGPVKRLIDLYIEADRLDDARQTLVEFLRRQHYTMYDYRSGVWHRSFDLAPAAKWLNELGYPIDAVRVVLEFVDDPRVAEARKSLSEDSDERITAALGEVKEILDHPLRLVPGATSALFESANRRDDVPPLDLVILIDPRSTEEPRLVSLFEIAARTAAGSPAVWNDMQPRLAELAARNPRDIRVRTAEILLPDAPGKKSEFANLSEKLADLVDATPLDQRPAGTRPNARQRREAARQIGLWLVARRLLAEKATYATGTRLARRALESANRQLDKKFHGAIAREWIELATAQRDEATVTELEKLMPVPPERP